MDINADIHDFNNGFADGRNWAKAQSFGDSYPLPASPSDAWVDGFHAGRMDYDIASTVV